MESSDTPKPEATEQNTREAPVMNAAPARDTPGGPIRRLLNHRPLCVIAAAAVWSAGFMVFAHAVRPLVRLEGTVVGTFLSSVICMAAAFASTWILVKGRFRYLEAVAMLLLGVAVNLLAYRIVSGLGARMIVGFSIIAGGFGMASMLARMVESARFIVPIGVVAAVADVWSVAAGPTRKILESKGSELVMRHAFVGKPAAAGISVQPISGAADIVFVGLFMCVAERLGLSVWRAAIGMFAGLAVGLAAASAFGGLPGLPFIAGGFIIANWKEVRPGKSEIVRTAVFVVAMLAVFAIVGLI
ncbi:MAG TPA: hypothetical protein VM186_05965 [Planctomycetota bacterium]|nr:hypothetical protein [Planctomycetota bacterium]